MNADAEKLLITIQNSLELLSRIKHDMPEFEDNESELHKLEDLLNHITRNIDVLDYQVISPLEVRTSGGNLSVLLDSWYDSRIFKFLDLLHIGILVADNSKRVIYTNQTAKDKLGDREYHIIPKENDVLGFIALNQDDSTYPVSREIYDKGCKTWFRLTSDKVILPNGQLYYFNTIEDISEWKLNERLLKLAAKTDEMTGTLNRKTGLEKLEKLLSEPNSWKTCSIAFIDIDGLKLINDKYGHNEGDYTIKSLASILLSSVRDSDVVSRYGGDEFFIILNNCTENLAEKAFSRMNKKLRELEINNPKPYSISFSYGIISFTNSTISDYTAIDLLKQADLRMYMTKAQKTGNISRDFPL